MEELSQYLAERGPKPIAVGFNPQSFENVFSTFYGVLKREIERYNRSALVDATSTTKEAYGAVLFPSVQIALKAEKAMKQAGMTVKPDTDSPAAQLRLRNCPSLRLV
jgi:hypothetical protein